MKLIECYVKNFGKLSDFSYNFSDGLNVIQKENGFGKSTLSAFIKSMLYGLEDTKRPGLYENDRKKYEPWQGGAWGGSLTISSGGKQYRIERSFFKKASLDEVRVYDLETESLTDIFAESTPGDILLGIDRDGFERTVFLSEREIDEKKVNNSVSAKLSRLTGVAFDMTELDSATKLLEEERKYYHKQGGNGAISEIANKINELEYRKAELLLLESKHENDAKEILEKENEIKRLKALAEKEMETEKQNALKQDRLKEYERKLGEKDDYAARAEKILEFFGGKIPEKETLYRANALKDELSKLKRDREELETKLSLSPPAPLEEEIDRAAHLSLKIRDNKEKLGILEEEKINTGASRSKKIKLLYAIGISLFVIGAALALISLPLAFVSVFGAAFIVTAFIKSRRNESSALDEKLAALASETEESEKKLASFINGFGLQDAGFDFAISEFKRRAKEKESVLISLKSVNERYNELYESYRAIASAYPIINEYPSVELAAKIDSFSFFSQGFERLDKECRELMEKFKLSEINESCEIPRERASDALISKERELSLLKNTFSIDEKALEELDEIYASLEILTESEKNAKYKYEIIKKTKSYLEAAKDSLTVKYLGKTREAFSNYVEIVSKSLGKFGIDTSFAITKTDGGQTRIKDSFSKGTRQLYDFALRLSFSDSLYENELPFIMLDDPFAYFDDDKLASAIALINEIGKKRQIVYFTATKSRT